MQGFFTQKIIDLDEKIISCREKIGNNHIWGEIFDRKSLPLVVLTRSNIIEATFLDDPCLYPNNIKKLMNNPKVNKKPDYK